MKCPVCDSTRFTRGKKGQSCQRCGYVNEPNYLKRAKEAEDFNNDKILEKL